MKGAANAGGNSETLSAARNAAGEADVQTSAPAQSPVSWTAWHKTRSQYQLRNDSTHNGAVARLTGFRDVTPGGGNAASYLGPLSIELAASESIPFTIEKSLVSLSVTAIELTWEGSDNTERKRTRYI